MSPTHLIALDWGTSSLRAYRFDAAGTAVEARHLAAGVVRLDRDRRDGSAAAAFEEVFEKACGDWVDAWPECPVIACGMVGSAQGWREAPYLEIPTSLDGLGRALTTVDTRSGAVIHIVPGVIERGVLPAVMRGEETQVAGALEGATAPADRPDAITVIGLPGSHSKWVLVRDRHIVHFDTFMTGEVFAALCEHTILGRTQRTPATPDDEAFDRGVQVARSPEGRAGVLSTIFSARSLGLVGALAAEAQADYLSGVLVGHELAALEILRPASPGAAPLVLAGSPELCRRYQRALVAFGHPRPVIAAQATERGLWRVAVAAGLVEDGPAVAAVHGAVAAVPRRPSLDELLRRTGLVAILRGVRPDEVAAIGAALYAAGLRILEVPLNAADALASIGVLRAALPGDCLVGAGTVRSPADVEEVRRAGGELIVMPHTDASVIRAARAAELAVMPGVATPSEAFAALAAGADALKMFPAEQLGAATLKAWRTVLPRGTAIVSVGGITPDSMAAFVTAGATGFGLGSALYRPGATAAEVAARGAEFVAAWRASSSVGNSD